jgi:AraC-like DNA-binding protein
LAAIYSSSSGVALEPAAPTLLKFLRIISKVSYPQRVKNASLILVLLPSSKKKSAILSPSKKYKLNNSGGINESKNFSKSAVSSDAVKLLEGMTSSEDEHGKYYPPRNLGNTTVSVFDRFEIAENLPLAERTAYVKTLLSELIILLSASTGEKMVQNEDELGARVIRYLNNNIDSDVSLDSLAKRFFVSKYYLCRAFKKHNGVSVHGYITHKRIMYAKQLIESGETASGAAYKVGFGDYSAFYRAYVKIVGKSPTFEQREGV